MKNKALRKIWLSIYLILGFLAVANVIAIEILAAQANEQELPLFGLLILFLLLLTGLSFGFYLFIILYFRYPARNIFLFFCPFLGGLIFATLALKSKSEPAEFKLEGKLWDLAALLGLFALNQTTGSFFMYFAHSKIPTWQIILDLIFFSLTIAYFVYWGRKRLNAWHLKNFWSTKWIVLVGMVCMFAWYLAWPYIVSLFNSSVPIGGNEEELMRIAANSPAWLMWIHVTFGASIMEETIVRLGIFELISPKHPKIALLISTVTFAALHMLNDSIADWRVWGVYLGISFILSFVYYKTRKVEAPTAMHTLWNGIVSLF